MVEIKKWTFNHYPWLRQIMAHGTQTVIIWRKAKSLTMSEEIIDFDRMAVLVYNATKPKD